MRWFDRSSVWVSWTLIVSQIAAAVLIVVAGIYVVAFQGVTPWFLLLVAFIAFWLWKVALPALRA